MTVKNIAVIGAGTMGNGIAHVFAQFGYPVALVDIKQEFLERALNTISTNLDRQIKKGVVTPEEKPQILQRISPSTDLATAVKDADLVIEAVNENFELKQSVFRALDEHTKPTAILASNTSSISLTKIAACTKRPAQVIGMHFMNPVPVMKLVEVIRALQTSDETFSVIESTAKAIGKVPVSCNDYPGFVSHRVLMPMINEAIQCVYENVATT